MDKIIIQHNYINATLKSGINIDGDIEEITEDGFLIDDNITGDIMKVKNDEIETVNMEAEDDYVEKTICHSCDLDNGEGGCTIPSCTIYNE